LSRRCQSCDKSFRPDGQWQRLCWPCWRQLRAEESKPRTIVVSPVDADLLLQAISLCHPDRHPPERHEICNRVTAALTVALKAAREAA
jgi:hypothetical protein